MQMYDRQGGEIKNVIPVDKGCIFYVVKTRELRVFYGLNFYQYLGFHISINVFPSSSSLDSG